MHGALLLYIRPKILGNYRKLRFPKLPKTYVKVYSIPTSIEVFFVSVQIPVVTWRLKIPNSKNGVLFNVSIIAHKFNSDKCHEPRAHREWFSTYLQRTITFSDTAFNVLFLFYLIRKVNCSMYLHIFSMLWR